MAPLGFDTLRYGFNFQWSTSWEPGKVGQEANHRALEIMREHGFNFVRVPFDYRFWTLDSADYSFEESVFETVDRYLAACREYGHHLSLNIHRGPGYCINSNHIERHNLWLDEIAQEAFIRLWTTLARRYRGVSSAELSFDLINEPPDVGQYGMTRDIHQALIRRVVSEIRAVDPDRTIVIDGLAGGNLAMPELSDLGVVMSGRGYQPMSVSHYRASWWSGSIGMTRPIYPDCFYEGVWWDRDAIVAYYEPWRKLEEMGVTVHIGEFGCYEYTPQSVALAWFKDLFSVYREFGWGFGLWEFEGAFGIAGHRRPGATFEPMNGMMVDRELLELMKEGMQGA